MRGGGSGDVTTAQRGAPRAQERERLLHLDPWAGAAGDMILAALVAAGGAQAERALRDAVAAIGLPGVTVETPVAVTGGLACRRVVVRVAGPQPPARTLPALEGLLDAASLSPGVRSRATAALRRLARVEAALHGVTVDQVHLHELGAADTLVDVVGTFAVLETLGVGGVTFGPVPLGSGKADTAHGRLSVPAPATLELLRGVPVFGGPEAFEVTTPTGALLLTELGVPSAGLPAVVVEAVGYGAGTREADHGPNVLRAVLGRAPGAAAAGPAADTVVLLAATMDDATPELLGHLHRRLLEAGALDAWWTPVFMKKGRPAVELTVVVAPVDEDRLTELVFRESTSFGLRRQVQERRVLERRWVTVEVAGRDLRVKIGSLGGEVVSVSPEHEDAAAVAETAGLPLKEVMVLAAIRARERLLD